MSGDDGSLLTQIPTLTTATFGVSTTYTTTPTTLEVAEAPEIMLPYGFIALLLALCLLFVGFRNFRKRKTPSNTDTLAQKLSAAPRRYHNDEVDGENDDFLNKVGSTPV